jgi:hypothetical protein
MHLMAAPGHKRTQRISNQRQPKKSCSCTVRVNRGAHTALTRVGGCLQDCGRNSSTSRWSAWQATRLQSWTMLASEVCPALDEASACCSFARLVAHQCYTRDWIATSCGRIDHARRRGARAVLACRVSAQQADKVCGCVASSCKETRERSHQQLGTYSPRDAALQSQENMISNTQRWVWAVSIVALHALSPGSAFPQSWPCMLWLKYAKAVLHIQSWLCACPQRLLLPAVGLGQEFVRD